MPWNSTPLLVTRKLWLREPYVLGQFHCCLVGPGTRNQSPDFHCTTLITMGDVGEVQATLLELSTGGALAHSQIRSCTFKPPDSSVC